MKPTDKRIQLKGGKDKKSECKSETIFLVICERHEVMIGFCEQTIGIFKHKEVAEFRANGAAMFAKKGSSDRYFVREAEMVCEETPNEFLANRLV